LSQDKRPNGAATSWSYDAANNITTVTSQAAIGGATTTASCYDTNNTELTYLQANSSTCTNSPSQSFGYDGVGDRTSLTAGSSVTNYCFNQESQLVTIAQDGCTNSTSTTGRYTHHSNCSSTQPRKWSTICLIRGRSRCLTASTSSYRSVTANGASCARSSSTHRDRVALCCGQMQKTHQIVRLGEVNAPFGQQGFQKLFDCLLVVKADGSIPHAGSLEYGGYLFSCLASARSSRARSCGVMEHSAFAQRPVEHRAREMLPLLKLVMRVHDDIDRHRNVPQCQAKPDHFLKPIHDLRNNGQ
jgi:hypothetical protein